MAEYRWNVSDFAAGYDAAAEWIHPFYLQLQGEVLHALPFAPDQPFLLVDAGGGSGRLVERALGEFPAATAVVFDQSEAFLALAERRLERFGDRARCVVSRLQDDWTAALPEPAGAVVSMSAIHHLDWAEKQQLHRRVAAALAPGGVFLNGDEVRAEDPAVYKQQLETWAAHMHCVMDEGRVAGPICDALCGWEDRNVTRFGQPKQSGDDCHETVDRQLADYSAAGLVDTAGLWHRELWALMSGRKPG